MVPERSTMAEEDLYWVASTIEMGGDEQAFGAARARKASSEGRNSYSINCSHPEWDRNAEFELHMPANAVMQPAKTAGSMSAVFKKLSATADAALASAEVPQGTVVHGFLRLPKRAQLNRCRLGLSTAGGTAEASPAAVPPAVGGSAPAQDPLQGQRSAGSAPALQPGSDAAGASAATAAAGQPLVGQRSMGKSTLAQMLGDNTGGSSAAPSAVCQAIAEVRRLPKTYSQVFKQRHEWCCACGQVI